MQALSKEKAAREAVKLVRWTSSTSFVSTGRRRGAAAAAAVVTVRLWLLLRGARCRLECVIHAVRCCA
jgi:hypothetical protein